MTETIKILVKKMYSAGVRKETKTIGLIDTEVPVSAISRAHSAWKRMIKRSVIQKNPGENIQSVNILAQPVDGAHVVVTLHETTKGFIPGRPVTRGGKLIGGPDVKKTLATLRRNAPR